MHEVILIPGYGTTNISMTVILTFAFPFEFVQIYTYNGLGMNVNNWGNKNCEREKGNWIRNLL